MSTIVTMSSTVGELQSGTTYRVRAKTAEQLIRNSQATKLTVRKTNNDDKSGKA